MKKQILTIGYNIPGESDNSVGFNDEMSLMDVDILLVSPNAISPWGKWVNFSSGGDGCYDVAPSRSFQSRISHFKKELKDFLESGKSVFIFLTKKEDYQLASGVTSPRKNEDRYNTYTLSNYSFLPVNLGTLTSASGKQIQFSGDPVFSEFYNEFKGNLEYQLYIEDSNGAKIIFIGKDKKKILGASYKVGTGNLIVLPILNYDEKSFTKIEKEEEYWNEKGLAFGGKLIKCLIGIDRNLSQNSEKTPMPEWAFEDQFIGKREAELNNKITKNREKIEEIKKKNDELLIELNEEITMKDLLFETGKSLEAAVIKALKILGYEAENFDDGDLEIDQVIVSPEKIRYIGECEGKDSKDINVDKFRQLQDALNADFERDEVEEKAFGILFGNAERLKSPSKRKLDFTTKCKTGAEREKIALVKTVDLFLVAKHAYENSDQAFKKACRDAIHNGLGQIVVFPAIPRKKKGSQKGKSNTNK